MQSLSKNSLCFSIFLLLCTFLIPYQPAYALSSSDFNAIMQKAEQRRLAIAQTMEASTVFIIAEGKADEIGMGTGFVVADGYILTNAHVVDGYHTFYITGKNIKPVKTKLIRKLYNDIADFALLKFTPQKDMPILSFNINPGRTDKISAWGYPYLVAQFDQNIDKIIEGKYDYVPPLVYTEGTISAFVHRDGGETIIHSASIASGNSGGPLINADGNVVGINTWVGSSSDEAAFINGALTAKAAINFLRSCNVEPQIVGSADYINDFNNSVSSDSSQYNTAISSDNTENFLSLISLVEEIALENGAGNTSVAPSTSLSLGDLYNSILSTIEPNNTVQTNNELAPEIVAQLTDTAKELYPDAVTGDADALAYIGMSLYMGEEAPEIPELGIAWLQKAVDQDQAAAIHLLGSIYLADFSFHKPQKGLDLLKKSANMDKEFASTLAFFLSMGEPYGVEQDIPNAKKAAQDGVSVNDPDAQAILAYINATGISGVRNDKSAFDLATKAEKKGNTLAYAVLSYLYFDSNSIKQNQKKALKYAQKAADDSDAFGLGLLASYYLMGEGVEVNFEKAFTLAQQSAEQGNEMGQFVLGALYSHTDFSQNDHALAWAYLELAAQKNFPNAAKELQERIEKVITKEQLQQAKQYVNQWRQEWGLSKLF